MTALDGLWLRYLAWRTQRDLREMHREDDEARSRSGGGSAQPGQAALPPTLPGREVEAPQPAQPSHPADTPANPQAACVRRAQSPAGAGRGEPPHAHPAPAGLHVEDRGCRTRSGSTAHGATRWA